MSRFVVPLLVFLAMVAVFALGLGRDPSYVPSPLVGKPAPAFDLPRLKAPDQRLTDTDLRGGFALVNVWATWCSGCRQEHDTLLAIAATGLAPIYGLNWKDDPALARDWLTRLGDPYTATGIDGDGRVAIDWGVYGAPETFLVGPDGTVLYKHIAPLTLEVWEREFVPRIAAAGPEAP